MARAGDAKWYCAVCEASFTELFRKRHLESKRHKRKAERRAARAAQQCMVPRASPCITFVDQERALVLGLSDRLPWTYECLLQATAGCREAVAAVPRLSGRELEIALAFVAVVQKFPSRVHRLSQAMLRRLRQQNKGLPQPASPEERILGHLRNVAALRRWMRVTGTLRSVLPLMDSAARTGGAKKKEEKERPPQTDQAEEEKERTTTMAPTGNPGGGAPGSPAAPAETGEPDWRAIVGYKDGPLFAVLSHLATDYNDAQDRRVMVNRGIQRRIDAPDAEFVCIGNNGRNGATNLLSRMQSPWASEGRLDPVVLFVDRRWWQPLGPHPLYVLHEEHVRHPVGHLHYVPWTEAAQGEDFECGAGGVLLWRGSPMGWVEVDQHAYNGQLVPGSYCQWTWDRDRGTYVEATRVGAVHIGLPRHHALVKASLQRYQPSTAPEASANAFTF